MSCFLQFRDRLHQPNLAGCGLALRPRQLFGLSAGRAGTTKLSCGLDGPKGQRPVPTVNLVLRSFLRTSPRYKGLCCSVRGATRGIVADCDDPFPWPEHEPMSWDEAFAKRYEEWSAPMTADVPFYVELARRSDGPLVELAIGNGRVAIPVAQATGRRVIGIDSSPAMLAQARLRAAEAGVELDLRAGDMRDLALDEPAALIYCPFPAPMHLPTWADRRRTFERVAASLRPDGRFAWNASAFDHRIAAALDGEHQDEPVCPTRSGTRSATTASTSSWTTARRAPSGGRRRTSGSGS